MHIRRTPASKKSKRESGCFLPDPVPVPVPGDIGIGIGIGKGEKQDTGKA
jgi:hypothetical protein